MNKITVEITNPMSLDKLNMLSAEFNLSVETLVNISLEHLIKDVEFVRQLRTMGEKNEHL
jgi:hypothetical protein